VCWSISGKLSRILFTVVCALVAIAVSVAGVESDALTSASVHWKG
jgi:hypothetical protein